MSDKIYRFIASLFLIFDDELEGDFPDDAYVMQLRERKKIKLAPKQSTDPISISHAGQLIQSTWQKVEYQKADRFSSAKRMFVISPVTLEIEG